MLVKSKTIKLGTRLAAASDKVYQLIAHGQRFASGTPTTFTTKTWSSWYSWNFAESFLISWSLNRFCTKPNTIFIVLVHWNNSAQSLDWKTFYSHGQRFASGTPTTFTTKTWSSWYSWNFAESGIKHNKSTQLALNNTHSLKTYRTLQIKQLKYEIRYCYL
jgi:hypothetical protein